MNIISFKVIEKTQLKAALETMKHRREGFLCVAVTWLLGVVIDPSAARGTFFFLQLAASSPETFSRPSLCAQSLKYLCLGFLDVRV